MKKNFLNFLCIVLTLYLTACANSIDKSKEKNNIAVNSIVILQNKSKKVFVDTLIQGKPLKIVYDSLNQTFIFYYNQKIHKKKEIESVDIEQSVSSPTLTCFWPNDSISDQQIFANDKLIIFSAMAGYGAIGFYFLFIDTEDTDFKIQTLPKSYYVNGGFDVFKNQFIVEIRYDFYELYDISNGNIKKFNSKDYAAKSEKYYYLHKNDDNVYNERLRYFLNLLNSKK